MFEVPGLEAQHTVLSDAVVQDLTTAGLLCADVAQAFRMADVLFCEARLSSQRTRVQESPLLQEWGYGQWRITECMRFRERIALIYLDAVLGYCVGARRLLAAVQAGAPIAPGAVRSAMEEGASAAAAEEILREPPDPAPRSGGRAPACPVQDTYEVARTDIVRAMEAGGPTQGETLHSLLSDRNTDACEAVVTCLFSVNRYAEALHIALCHQTSPTRSGARRVHHAVPWDISD